MSQDVYLGEFRRGPAIFTVFDTSGADGGHTGESTSAPADGSTGGPADEPVGFTERSADGSARSLTGGPSDRPASTGRRFRVDCSDGNGPGEVCTFTSDESPTWRGAWNGDEWCVWIEAEARKVVKQPER
ncbi:hypothetical protein [Glycomyces tenuis]|uniref:hypothetical protein n=1 Tax=Glycomyces tenuis TaxID=58116 RepID=UPI0004292213|nr:hypothetical protein [Glycomyces tenuis]